MKVYSIVGPGGANVALDVVVVIVDVNDLVIDVVVESVVLDVVVVIVDVNDSVVDVAVVVAESVVPDVSVVIVDVADSVFVVGSFFWVVKYSVLQFKLASAAAIISFKNIF